MNIFSIPASWFEKKLLLITANRPVKTIDVNGPYLERYFMGEVFGFQIWLHRFLKSDSERHLHNHPWNAVSIILLGRYQEDLNGWERRNRRAGSLAFIGKKHWHRISWVKQGTWTLMLIGRSRRILWWFKDTGGMLQPMLPSKRDWWKDYGTRNDPLKKSAG